MENKEHRAKLKQDYRVICLYSQERQTGFVQRDLPCTMLSYYDEISVTQVEPTKTEKGGNFAQLNLRRAHEIAHQIIRKEQKSYFATQAPNKDTCIRFPQVLIAFTDYLPSNEESKQPNEQAKYYTEEELYSFWNNTKDPLFFVSMIHLGEQSPQISCESKTIKNIRGESTEKNQSVFAKVLRLLLDRDSFPTTQFLVYFSFDHSDLILLGRQQSFHDYAQKIFELDYTSQGLITDSITLWSFQYLSEPKDPQQANLALDRIIEQSEERFTAHFRFGVRNYRQAKDFVLRAQANDPNNINTYCSLGRNDMSLLNHNANLKWIGEILRALSQSDWCNTYDLCLLLPDLIEQDFAGHTATPFSADDITIRALGKRLEDFEQAYREGCAYINVQPDEIWLRWLSEAVLQASSFLRNKMSVNIGICLTPQIRDLLKYGKCLFSAKENLQIEHIEQIRFCFEQFFSNVLILIDSMNHSNRQFVQSPAFHVAAFEMPPKIMAYYTAVTSKLSDILAQEHEQALFYGYTISPKFANALYVTSLAVQKVVPDAEYISIAVDENSLYDLRLTTQTLAHELSHFVGGKNRCRKSRATKLCLYVLCRILQNIANQMCNMVLQNEEIVKFSTTKKFAEKLYDDLKTRYSKFAEMVYLRDTFHYLKWIPVLFCQDYVLRKSLYNNLIDAIKESDLSNAFINCFATQVYQEMGLPKPKKELTWFWVNDPLVCAELRELFFKKLQYLKYFEAVEREKWEIDPLLWTKFPEFFPQELQYQEHAEIPDFEDRRVKPLHPYWQACYLFRETFADLQMILLFHMDMEEYLDIVLPSEMESMSRDLIMRVLAVTSVLAAREDTSMYHWSSDTLRQRLSLSQNYNFVTEDIDTMMWPFLTEYLEECATNIAKSFDEDPEIRKTIESIKRCFIDNSVRSSQESILELICSYQSEMLQNCREYYEVT